MKKTKYKHLFFDLDHTLWDFETNAHETMRELYEINNLKERGITDFENFFAHYSHHNEKLWDRYTKGFIKQEELRWKRMWLALLDFKIADEPLARKMAVEFLERLPYKKHLFPYCAEILNYLKQQGYELHLVTNGFDSVQLCKIQSCDIHHHFSEMITSECSNSLKPNKEIFDFALQKTGAKVEESIMIGDNLDADIRGGQNAGWDTVFVNHLKIETDVKPTYTIYHLQELEQIF